MSDARTVEVPAIMIKAMALGVEKIARGDGSAIMAGLDNDGLPFALIVARGHQATEALCALHAKLKASN